LFQLAEQFQMPVGELMETVSSVEIRAWAKYYEYKAELAKRKQR